MTWKRAVLIAGRIQTLNIDEGDEVKSGQVIAELDRVLE